MKTRCAFAPLALMALCALTQAALSAELPEGWFEFAMPPLGSERTLVDMSWLSPEPAGAGGLVRIEAGRFVDARGRRLRLLGTNCTFAGAFPPRDAAHKIAARMRAFGMNVVRFHHIDTTYAPRGLWLRGKNGLDPKQLDALDWFIHHLIQHGIYVNLNLHVSRTYAGIPKGIARAFRYGKGLDNFYPRFIEMQREYARMLLTHRNPYTKTTYANEPGVLCIELNNENSILTKRPEVLTALPDPFGAELARQWRAWLKQRYENTKALRAAWDELAEPLGDELLANRDFVDGGTRWALEAPRPAQGAMETVHEGPQHGTPALRCELTALGAKPWHFQVHQVGLDLKDGQAYTASFWAKASPARTMNFGVRMDCPPWTFVGCTQNLPLTEKWQRFAFTFKCVEPKPRHSRLSFNFQNTLGTCWVADVSLRPGGFIGLPKDQSLEEGNVTLPGANASPTTMTDFWRFLIDTERGYVAGMKQYLKDTLRVKAHVVDTQVSYGGIAGVHREATLCDFADIHSYWQHPRFPGRPWDGNNWFIPNTSMVANPEGGTLARLALHRVDGKPLTVSEYDHPAPSDYSAEMFPMLAAFAALQDWDAIYQFNYTSSEKGWTQKRISGYFELANHPGKMCFIPVAAVMFRAAGVAAAHKQAVLTVPEDQIAERLANGKGSVSALWQEAGFALPSVLARRVALRFARSGALVVSEKTEDIQPEPGPIVWDASDPKRAAFTVNAPSVCAAVGFIAGQKIKLGDVTIEVSQTQTNWASVALAALDAKPIAESGRLLLVAAGRVENTGMGWDEKRTTLARRWGSEPTIAEGIAATVTLARRGEAKVCALDAAGMRQSDVPTKPGPGGRIALKIGPEYKTLWYLIEPR